MADLETLWKAIPPGVTLTVVMEPTRNAWVPLAAWFRRRGAAVIMVPPDQSADLRDYYSKHAKSDRLDSRVLARLPLLHPEGLRSAHGLGPADALRRATKLRASLVKRRNVILARLDSYLNRSFTVHPDLAGQRISLRLDDHLMHAIADGRLIKTWPLPIPAGQRIQLRGARAATGELPNPPPRSTQGAQRRVPADGVIMVARQRLRIGRAHAGKIVTVIAEDTCFRVLHEGHELAIHPRTSTTPITRFKAWATTHPVTSD